MRTSMRISKIITMSMNLSSETNDEAFLKLLYRLGEAMKRDGLEFQAGKNVIVIDAMVERYDAMISASFAEIEDEERS